MSSLKALAPTRDHSYGCLMVIFKSLNTFVVWITAGGKQRKRDGQKDTVETSDCACEVHFIILLFIGLVLLEITR